MKPGSRTNPKHVYLLEACAVREITANKPHAFCVHENSNNDMMVFAAKNKQQLEQWLTMLTRVKPLLGQVQGQTQSQSQSQKQQNETIPAENSSEPESEPPEELEGMVEHMSKKDLAILYFEEYDISPQMVRVH